jgi:hypothetical protein
MHRCVAGWALWLQLLLASAHAANASEGSIKILFVGNSYTYVNDLPRIVQLMAIQSGQRRLPEVRMVTGPGFTFEDHWKLAGPTKALAASRWDYVVLQEQSQAPLQDKQKMQQFGRLLIGSAQREHATVLLFVTWPRANHPGDQAGISNSYAELARSTGAKQVQVGPAWQHLHAKHPEIELYSPDGSHPSPLGSYLAACMFYRLIYTELPKATAAMTLLTSQHSDYGYAQRSVPVPVESAQLAAVREACAQSSASPGAEPHWIQ